MTDFNQTKRREYEATLAAFTEKGARFANIPKLTACGKAAGLTADDIIADAHAHGITDHDERIRANWNGSYQMPPSAYAVGHTRYRPRRSDAKRTANAPTANTALQRTVRRMIEAGRDVATMDAVRQLSPQDICPDTDPLARRVQCEQMLLAMFDRSDVVRLRMTKDDNLRGTPGGNMDALSNWLGGIPHPSDFGEIVRIQPLTGKKGKTTGGKPSFDATSCIADYRHILMEFDEMPIDDQCRFWAGFIRSSPLAPYLVCLTYSGGKSIHGVLAADCGRDADAYKHRCGQLAAMFASDPDKAYCLDRQAHVPLTGARLAGAFRKDTGKIQRLLYVRQPRKDDEGTTGSMILDSTVRPVRPTVTKSQLNETPEPPKPVRPTAHNAQLTECDGRCAACEIERAALCFPNTLGKLWAETCERSKQPSKRSVDKCL